MKYKIFFILLFSILLIGMVTSLEDKMVRFKFEIDYTPNCVSECISTNITTNQTIEFITNCTTTCDGTIILSPMDDDIEEETTIAYTIDLNDVGSGVAIIGYQKIQLGNESDMLNVFNRLDDCLDCANDLNTCTKTNANISIRLMTCEKDIGYESNYTNCDKNLNNCNNNIDTKNSQLETKDKEISELKSKKIWWGIGGIILGYLIIKFGVPYWKGRETPKDETRKDVADNPGY